MFDGNWWLGTESNRRRQPFQGCLPNRPSGWESADVTEGKRVGSQAILGWCRIVRAVFGSSMFAYGSRLASKLFKASSFSVAEESTLSFENAICDDFRLLRHAG